MGKKYMKEYYWQDLEDSLKGRTPLCKWTVRGFGNIDPLYGYVVKKPDTCKWAGKSQKWIAYVVSYELGSGKINTCHNSEPFRTKKNAEKYLFGLKGEIVDRHGGW